MWDSRITELMRPQSHYTCQILPRNTIWEEPENNDPFYLIPDYETDEDGEKIAKSFGHLPFLSGGSGLLKPLAEYLLSNSGTSGQIPETAVPGKALLIAGS